MLRQPFSINEFFIETARLLLVPVTLEYTADVFKEFNEEIAFFMNPVPPRDISEAEAWVKASRQKMQNGKEVVCAVLLKPTKEYVGTVGLHRIDTATPELGVWIKKIAQGNQYGREAVSAIKEWADANVDYEYLQYPVAAANIASRKISESLGGVVEREFMGKNGKGVPMAEVEYRIYRK